MQKIDYTRKICLVFLVSESFDCLSDFEEAFREMGFDVEAIKIPNLWIDSLNRDYVDRLKALLKEKSRQQFVIFSPQSTELFLGEPDFTIIFSAYRKWFDHKRMRVIPHLWTPVKPPASIDSLRWTSKPPFRIGFMGRDYANSGVANLTSRAPMPLKEWLLHGSYLRHPRFITLMNELGFSVGAINTFPRAEAIKFLKEGSSRFGNFELDIIEKSHFTGSPEEMREYINHLERNTYIVCPRGTENYSYRIYETLGRGRIPVIIDTNVVLPREINWEMVSIRVPYRLLNRISDVIIDDYMSKSAAEFVERQSNAFSSLAELRTLRWVRNVASEIVSNERRSS